MPKSLALTDTELSQVNKEHSIINKTDENKVFYRELARPGDVLYEFQSGTNGQGLPTFGTVHIKRVNKDGVIETYREGEISNLEYNENTEQVSYIQAGKRKTQIHHQDVWKITKLDRVPEEPLDVKYDGIAGKAAAVGGGLALIFASLSPMLFGDSYEKEHITTHTEHDFSLDEGHLEGGYQEDTTTYYDNGEVHSTTEGDFLDANITGDGTISEYKEVETVPDEKAYVATFGTAVPAGVALGAGAGKFRDRKKKRELMAEARTRKDQENARYLDKAEKMFMDLRTCVAALPSRKGYIYEDGMVHPDMRDFEQIQKNYKRLTSALKDFDKDGVEEALQHEEEITRMRQHYKNLANESYIRRRRDYTFDLLIEADRYKAVARVARQILPQIERAGQDDTLAQQLEERVNEAENAIEAMIQEAHKKRKELKQQVV